jgi:peptide/nickel transport system substrate-binding protein
MIRGLGKEGWFGWPTSPHLQALRTAWLDAPDLQAQQTVAADIQRTVFDEVPYIPTGQWFNPSAWRSNVTGIVSGASPVFWNLKKA